MNSGEEAVAHLCPRGRTAPVYRPYPKLLCSCCLPTDPADDVTLRELVKRLNMKNPEYEKAAIEFQRGQAGSGAWKA